LQAQSTRNINGMPVGIGAGEYNLKKAHTFFVKKAFAFSSI
jgi:hypothetical protein